MAPAGYCSVTFGPAVNATAPKVKVPFSFGLPRLWKTAPSPVPAAIETLTSVPAPVSVMPSTVASSVIRSALAFRDA